MLPKKEEGKDQALQPKGNRGKQRLHAGIFCSRQGCTWVLCARLQGWCRLKPRRWEGLLSSPPGAWPACGTPGELAGCTPEGFACPLAVGLLKCSRIWSRWRALGSALPLKRSCSGSRVWGLGFGV